MGKKIEIVKIYDESMLKQATHLISSKVYYGNDLNEIYQCRNSAELIVINEQFRPYGIHLPPPYYKNKNEDVYPFKYIAEFREVEDEACNRCNGTKKIAWIQSIGKTGFSECAACKEVEND